VGLQTISVAQMLTKMVEASYYTSGNTIFAAVPVYITDISETGQIHVSLYVTDTMAVQVRSQIMSSGI
jgi:hypothetical protein